MAEKNETYILSMYIHYLQLLTNSLASSMPISVNRDVQDNNEKHIIHTCLPFITFEIFFSSKR